MVGIMYSKKRIIAKQGDRVKEEFDDFLQKVVKCNKTELPHLIKRLCVLISESKSLPGFLVCLQICVHFESWKKCY